MKICKACCLVTYIKNVESKAKKKTEIIRIEKIA